MATNSISSACVQHIEVRPSCCFAGCATTVKAPPRPNEPPLEIRSPCWAPPAGVRCVRVALREPLKRATLCADTNRSNAATAHRAKTAFGHGNFRHIEVCSYGRSERTIGEYAHASAYTLIRRLPFAIY
eukprot:6203779-Pleurochrysis_carterae.AAC.2